MNLLGIVESGNTLTFILLMHVKTARKKLVEELCTLGLSVSYDCACHQAFVNAVCENYEENGTVCTPNLHGQVFTTANVDNIDRSPSFTTATVSFHVTSISVIQHPSTTEEAMTRGKLSCGSRRLKRASILCMRVTPTFQMLCRRTASLL